MHQWLVVRTLAGAEWAAHRTLLNRGIDCFLPSKLAEIRRGRWLQAIVRPLFPGYMFVAPGRSLETVRTTSGVFCLLHQGSELLSVSPSEMAKIRKTCESMFYASLPSRVHVREWQIGDVVPAPPPFQGLPVQIVAIDSHGRVTACLGRLTLTFSVDGALHQSVPNCAEHERNVLHFTA
jgi:transcription antitermination factor NusG